MTKIDIKSNFHHLQAQMEAKLTANRETILHPCAKGDASELNWIEWLKTYLPKRYCVDKAFVIDCDNNISEQIDLVIYDQQYTPFVFKQDSVIFIPAESVYAIFEVKQELTKDYIEYAGKKAESVRLLKRTSATIYHAGGTFSPKEPGEIIAGILTLCSSWAEPLGQTFETHIKSLIPDQRLDIGCALQKGSFIVDYSNHVNIKKSTQEESLIYFFLNLLMKLQALGTVPAMDIGCYAATLDSISNNAAKTIV